MTRLLDLPDEILLMMGGHLSPHSLKQLALVSRRLRGPAQEALHYDPVAGAYIIVNETMPLVDKFTYARRARMSILRLARTLLAQPELAAKVHGLHLIIPSIISDFSDWSFHQQISSQLPSLQEHAVERVQTFDLDTSRWEDALDRGHTAAWASLLIALAPNLKRLSLDIEAESWNDFFHPVFGPGEAKTNTLAVIPGFNSVEKLSLSTKLINLDEGWLCFPSLKTFDIARACEVVRTEPQTTNYGVESLRLTSTLGAFTHLWIHNDHVDNATKSHVIAGTSMVKILDLHLTEAVPYMEWKTHWDESMEDYIGFEGHDLDYTGTSTTGEWTRRISGGPLVPGCSYEYLFGRLDTVAAQLEKLSITLTLYREIPDLTMNYGDPRFGAHLHKFTVLRYLEIPEQAIHRYTTSSGRLVTALPPKLEELHINYPSEDAATMINDIVTGYNSAPYLRNVYINTRTNPNPVRSTSILILDMLAWDEIAKTGMKVHFDASKEEMETWAKVEGDQ
ncbi:hypothetical protein K491DRAFT_680487 [Lophiostoma macrostomum CBS 122681]|uniref:F-box domain-containing protein n=1 Tax=Lophiostoma macrostomum CBS 122681 TaxID=1314788 RepID=A0A6A6T3P0_9PLEO|nr:hypothetical protein K491DRAFT_680487 [Lophiostoma macrostomum CBS 122681]